MNKSDKENKSSGGIFDITSSAASTHNEEMLSNLMYGMTMLPRPFGILWDFEYMEDYLKFKGYKIIERTDEESEKTCKMAVKPGDKYIPDYDRGTNILEVFTDELQKTLLKWLKSIDGKVIE